MLVGGPRIHAGDLAAQALDHRVKDRTCLNYKFGALQMGSLSRRFFIVMCRLKTRAEKPEGVGRKQFCLEISM